jgi:hypothetical protein
MASRLCPPYDSNGTLASLPPLPMEIARFKDIYLAEAQDQKRADALLTQLAKGGVNPGAVAA